MHGVVVKTHNVYSHCLALTAHVVTHPSDLMYPDLFFSHSPTPLKDIIMIDLKDPLSLIGY